MIHVVEYSCNDAMHTCAAAAAADRTAHSNVHQYRSTSIEVYVDSKAKESATKTCACTYLHLRCSMGYKQHQFASITSNKS
eukprot:19908-Heterococcus_DN1.PRE.1